MALKKHPPSLSPSSARTATGKNPTPGTSSSKKTSAGNADKKKSQKAPSKNSALKKSDSNALTKKRPARKKTAQKHLAQFSQKAQKALKRFKKHCSAQAATLIKRVGTTGRGTGKRPRRGQGKRRSSRPTSRRFSPLLFAFMAGLLMAAICFVGIQSIRTRDNAKPIHQIVQKTADQAGQAGQPGQAGQGNEANVRENNARINGQGRATPLVLPSVGEVPADNSPLENTMEAALAIQQALAELQVATSTDRITQFTEQAKQANFALLQAAVNANIPSSNIRITQQEEREHKLGQYTFQRLALLGPSNFPQLLANSLHSWHSQGRLFRLQPNTYAISIQGVTTHEITLYTQAADFKRAFSSPSPKVQSPVYPAKRGAGSPAHIVIVIDDLGASSAALNRLMRLNYPVTCAFWPDAAHTRKGAQLAHAKGLEVLIHMPMEPLGYPKVKPGTNALLVSMNRNRITTLVQNAIHKVPHAAGLNNHMGSKFTQNSQQARHVLNVLAHNNLFVLDSVTHGKSVLYDTAKGFNMPRYKRSVFLDADDSPAAITAALAKTERIAKLTGQAIAIGHPLPATLTALEQWQHRRDTTIRIVRLKDLPNNGL